ncbi:MAG: threonylcarbamoyl-AMP synthase [Lentimicrobiaceae bacterium]|jgi:tRNA threonylcarbamoyl adenosine modification protein (Sua5/YciO/YrdC/YwlC family)|nr:threonylcarbamoyl-AMP synthase [Lentimicrobiaceae bacterium]
MFLKIYPENPNPRYIKTIVDTLNNGGLIIFPTDTVYGLAGSIRQPKTVERINQIKGNKKENTNFSFIFNNLSMLSEFTKPISNDVYKLMKRNLPGPFTFILEANNNIPKIFNNKKRTIGIRIPDNPIALTIVEELGHPIMTTSVRDEDEILDYMTDPELMNDRFKDIVDIIIDGGYGDNNASTIVNCTENEIIIQREGKGELIW